MFSPKGPSLPSRNPGAVWDRVVYPRSWVDVEGGGWNWIPVLASYVIAGCVLLILVSRFVTSHIGRALYFYFRLFYPLKFGLFPRTAIPALPGTSFQFFSGGGNAFFAAIGICVRGYAYACTRTWAHGERFAQTLLLYAYINVVRVHSCCIRT